jgi:hypothetical protein
MSTIPNQEPGSLRVGDTWRWTRTLDDYPADAWVLKYRFKNSAGGFEITATASGTDHSITVVAATSAAYTAGSYTWTAWVEGGTSEKYTVDSGSCELLSDYRSGLATVALDDRSHARKTLDAIEAWIEGRDLAVAEYEIAGRRMKYIPIPELLKMRSRYQLEVQSEDNVAKLARGEGVGRKIQFRA